MKLKNLTQEHLKSILHYNPKTGVFTNKISRSRNTKKGEVAGYVDKTGYIRISIKNKDYMLHRLAWLYMEGYFPENYIDHIDRNPQNNKWNNLREVSRSCNMRNCKISKNNKSGINGVLYSKINKKWKAVIAVNKKTKHLGIYKYKIDAVKSRWDAEKKYGYAKCNPKSSAYLYLKKHGAL